MDDYSLGWRMDFDKSMAMKKAFAQVAMVGSNGNYYFRGNIMT